MNTPTSQHAALARASSLLREHDLPGAEAACREFLLSAPRNAAGLHLLALIRNEAGDAREAERLMRESIAHAPRQPEFHNNLANLLRREGRIAEAIAAYREALAASPQHQLARIGLARVLNDAGEHAAAEERARELIAADARNHGVWLLLAESLREQLRLGEAEAATQRAIALAPADPLAHHGLGAVLARTERSEEALQALERAATLGLRGFDLAFTRGVALLQLYRLEEAEECFEQSVKLQPRHAEAQLRLASLRFMRGDDAFARDLRAAATAGDPNLQMLLAKVLMRAGDYAGSEGLLRDLSASVGPGPEVRTALAELLLEQGRLKEAEHEAAEAAAVRPHDARVVEALVVVLLCRGLPADALPFIRAQRARHPQSQSWIAHEATAARLLGDSLYQEINDYDRLVQSYNLESPPGWSSMAELNAAVLESLNARHRFARHPLDQSLRNGSRTTRNLLCEPDSALRSLIEVFDLGLEEYVRTIGVDAEHPLSSRNSGAARIENAWSVQLRRGGLEVNHVQAHGWISAVYYVFAPAETEDETLKAGWLKFGEPRYPAPGVVAEGVVQPRAGRLVLFPSYMWRGTTALRTGPLTSVSFQALPRSP